MSEEQVNKTPETTDTAKTAVQSINKEKDENISKNPAEDPRSEIFDSQHALYTEKLQISEEQVNKTPDIFDNAEKAAESINTENNENVSKNPAEDPGSEFFDPLHALYTENLQISKRKPLMIYQNLASFDSALKKHGIWGLQQKPNKAGTVEPSTSKQATMEQTSTRRFLPHQMPIKAAPGTNFNQRHTKNLLKWLEKIEGPLKPLADAMTSKQQIRVVVRNEHGVRGHMDGIVICYDRHWNVLLKDVTEVWCRRKFKYGVNKTCEADNPSQDCTAVLEELGITLPKQTVKSLNRKNVQITRQLDQLLIRGEQIVMINVLDKNK